MVNKMTVFVLVITLTVVMFHYGGLLGDGGSLIDLLTDLENFETRWADILIGLFVTVTGIVFGFVTRDPYVGAMGTIIGVYVAPHLLQIKEVYSIVSAENNVLATILFAPFLFLLVMTFIDWWRGRD